VALSLDVLVTNSQLFIKKKEDDSLLLKKTQSVTKIQNNTTVYTRWELDVELYSLHVWKSVTASTAGRTVYVETLSLQWYCGLIR